MTLTKTCDYTSKLTFVSHADDRRKIFFGK
jgi:hypothetical protein